MTSIQPELWVDNPREAVAFYEAAFGATVLHEAGGGDDIVAQLAVGEAAFWVAATSASLKRLSPRTLGGATGRSRWSSKTQGRRRAGGRCRCDGIVARAHRAWLAAGPDH